MLLWHSSLVSLDEYLREQSVPPIQSWPKLTNTAILIDEAQKLYPLGRDQEVWATLKFLQQNAEGTCYVVLFAAYGEHNRGLAMYPLLFPSRFRLGWIWCGCQKWNTMSL